MADAAHPFLIRDDLGPKLVRLAIMGTPLILARPWIQAAIGADLFVLAFFAIHSAMEIGMHRARGGRGVRQDDLALFLLLPALYLGREYGWPGLVAGVIGYAAAAWWWPFEGKDEAPE